MLQQAHLGILLMLLSALAFAGGDIGVKVLGENLSPWQTAGGRAFLGLTILMILVRFNWRYFMIPQWPWQCLLGLSSTLGLICTIQALKGLPLSIAMPVLYLYPALGALLSPLINREKPTPADWLAIALALIAVIFLTQGVGGDTGGSWPGVMWALASAFFIALMANLSRLQAKSQPVKVMLFYLFSVNLTICLPLTLLLDRPVIPAGPDVARLMLFIAPMLVIGLFLMFRAYKYITAHRGGVIQTLEVVLGSLYGLVFLGEPLTVFVAVGAVFMLASAIVISLTKQT